MRHHGVGLFPYPLHPARPLLAYHCGGPYEYRAGINPRALIALAAGVFAALAGLARPVLRSLYDYAWFVGFFLSAAVCYGVMLSTNPRQLSTRRS